MKIVFFGTPYYALPVLTSLHKSFVTGPGKSPITAVVTQSPKPVGRKQILSYSPIDKWAHEHKIPTFYSTKELLENGTDADFGVLASYGEIVPQEVINQFPKGILVIHPSLLPKYRGASPVTEAIRNGDDVTGVTIFRMDSKMDHGPIISQFKKEISPEDTTQTLRDRLFESSAEVLVELIEPWQKGKITPKVQDESQATYTKILTKQDGLIVLQGTDPLQAERFIRAMTPWPGAWTKVKLQMPNDKFQIKRLKLIQSHIENNELVLDEVQLEGKNPVSWKQFTEAYPDLKFTN